MQASKPKYHPEFLQADAADELFSALQNNVSWCRETFRIFGRVQKVPRYSAWYGDAGASYRYTGLDHRGEGWPAFIAVHLQAVNKAANSRFNFVILNRYDHGNHHMGWHRDDEIGISSSIASLSLGAERRFRVQRSDGEALSYDLGHGSLLCFDGRDRHMLSKTKRTVDVRINLTFRRVAYDG